MGSLQLRRKVECSLAVVSIGVACWLPRALKPDRVAALADSQIYRKMVDISRTDAARAFVAGILGPVGALFFLLSFVRQRVRRLRLGDAAGDELCAPDMGRVLEWIKTWHCGKTLRWLILWSVIIFSLSFIGKWTYLALSALAEAIEDWNVFAVIVLLSFIGFCVFMNPLMPGPVVYMLCGVVITGKFCSMGRDDEDDPCSTAMLWTGFIIASITCLVTKLIAVCGQMLIGRTFGQRVSILRMCGVEKPLMRAIEWVLKKPGLFPGKVFVLCGGPDWPTSVVCGLLGCGYGQICLGTTPMGIFLLPSAFAGSVLNMTDGVWKAISSLVLLLSLVSQAALSMLALTAVGEFLGSDDPEIKKFLYDPRPEHAPIVELNKKQEAFDKALKFYTSWSAMQPNHQYTLVLGAVLTYGAAAITTLFTSELFRPYKITSRIGKPYDNDPPGLDGKWHSLVHPLGWAVTGVFVIGYVCFEAWGRISAKIAEAHVDEFQDLDESGSAKERSPDANDADWPSKRPDGSSDLRAEDDLGDYKDVKSER